MSKRTNYFTIGLFTSICLVVLVVFLILLGAKSWFTPYQNAETYFNESVQGLDVGSPVKFRGVTIGKVENIDIVNHVYPGISSGKSNKEDRYIYVRFSLQPKLRSPENIKNAKTAGEIVQRYVKEGLRVSLATQDLVGNVFLEINFSDPKKNPLLPISWQPKDVYIPSARSTLSRLSDSLDYLLAQLNSIKFSEIAGNFNTLLVTANSAIDNANVGQVSGELSQTLEQITQLTGSVNGLLTGEGSKDVANEFKKNSNLLGETLKNTSSAMNQLNALLSRANQLSASQQQNLVQTVTSLKQMSMNLENLTDNLKNNPSSVIFGQPVEPVDPSK
jgi:phospholipid/cholesterol/gamma-HCH transport system substrate-binding protein